MTTILKDYHPTDCDGCGFPVTTLALVPWVYGLDRRLCGECFAKEYGMTMEEKVIEEDKVFLEAVDRLFGGVKHD
jgi:hypothetical protein